jgi:hypothetical protein
MHAHRCSLWMFFKALGLSAWCQLVLIQLQCQCRP